MQTFCRPDLTPTPCPSHTPTPPEGERKGCLPLPGDAGSNVRMVSEAYMQVIFQNDCSGKDRQHQLLVKTWSNWNPDLLLVVCLLPKMLGSTC